MTESESGIEKLRKRIYSKRGESTIHQRRPLHEDAYEVESVWRQGDVASPSEDTSEEILVANDPWTPPQESPRMARVPVRSSLLKKFTVTVLAASSLFFLGAVGIAGYMYYSGRSEVRNPILSWSGPPSVGAGDEVLLTLTINNPNLVPLLATDLRVQFPPGARSPTNADIALTEYRESLGTIGPRESKTATIRAVLFGPEETTQTIGTSLGYRLADSDTAFTSHSSTTVLLARAPLSLSVKGVGELTSGQSLTLTVVLANTATNPVRDVAFRAVYPPGFQIKSVEPKATEGNEYWTLGDMPFGSKKELTISGTLVGEGGEDRVFRFEVGNKGTTNTLAGVFQSGLHTVSLARPFLDLELLLNGQKDNVVVTHGKNINGSVAWKNNLEYALSDVEVMVKLQSEFLDRQSVITKKGFYKSVDNTLLWTKHTAGELERIAPGETGTLEFSFNTLELAQESSIRNPSMEVEVTAKATRSGESNVPETLERYSAGIVRFGTALKPSARVVWSEGPFENTGTVPPKVDEPTTYTVLWSLTNTTNDVRETEFTATLPVYVTWENKVSPEGAQVRFDEKSRTISWQVGDTPSGTGFSSQAPQVAFQVAFTPSVSQRGSVVPLLTSQTLRGVDRFTGNMIETTYTDLTTRLSTDPAFATDSGVVAE